MRMSYGVVWRDGKKPLARGKLELLPRAVRLDGMAGTEPAAREIPYENLSEIRIGRAPAERIYGRASPVLPPRTGSVISSPRAAPRGVTAETGPRRPTTPRGTASRRALGHRR